MKLPIISALVKEGLNYLPERGEAERRVKKNECSSAEQKRG